MKHDRFSAQLRQHLLETAHERPADGQLAAIDERAAITGQRHPIVARLTWFPGRIGPFPFAALRFGVIAVVLVGGIASGALLVGAGGSKTIFQGTWTSTDTADGSSQTLIVAAGGKPAVHFEDAHATGFACRADTVKVFMADGIGEITGERLDVVFPDGGGCLLRRVEIEGAYYEYDAGTDTIVDFEGITWSRE